MSEYIEFENFTDEFYCEKFGEFPLVIDTETGFSNTTKLCGPGKKQYSEWFNLKRTKLLYKEMGNIPRHILYLILLLGSLQAST